MQNIKRISWGGTQPGCRQKAGLLAAFLTRKKIEGFVSFVKNTIS